jgi:hypothetical protein
MHTQILFYFILIQILHVQLRRFPSNMVLPFSAVLRNGHGGQRSTRRGGDWVESSETWGREEGESARGVGVVTTRR